VNARNRCIQDVAPVNPADPPMAIGAQPYFGSGTDYLTTLGEDSPSLPSGTGYDEVTGLGAPTRSFVTAFPALIRLPGKHRSPSLPFTVQMIIWTVNGKAGLPSAAPSERSSTAGGVTAVHSPPAAGSLVIAAATFSGLEMKDRWRAPGMTVGGGAPIRLAVS
jgi:hypothetical protein